MVLVDTSVWVDHLRKGNARLKDLLLANEVLTHPFIIGELACGNLKNRTEILHHLDTLPHIVQASHDEVMRLIETRKLYGQGIGLVDAHLLASTLLSGCQLWTMDKRFEGIARSLYIGM
jgi:hypothetical protein